ncbi:uncharacterized protein [Arachis hypogaea]|uniref:uncharacterized protein n=1 Tax=Arachis hypogaea TaxID=3818 RepID=UPI0010FC4F37|nr:uncharacterized protein LOC114924663 [Arachis hypogaea]
MAIQKDGTQVQLMSTKFQKYLAAENGGGADLVANRASASGWETFKLWRVSDTSFNFRVFNKQFLGLENQGSGNKIAAVSNLPSNPKTFQIVRNSNDPNKIRIKASNVMFLQNNWDTYITEDDFIFMSENGLTAVRIPIGWWIAQDPSPPKPFVGGSLAALDNAFTWTQ